MNERMEMGANWVEKITLFVTRHGPNGDELLLFEHGSGSIQIPAGTIEPGEDPHAAALREGREETGLHDLESLRYLGAIDTQLPPDQRMIATATAVYAQPQLQSFDWAHFRRGLTVRVERAAPGFTHITYEEFDHQLNPSYISYRITGWVPDDTLTSTVRRHFFLCTYSSPTADRWEVYDPPHTWVLFWAPLNNLPAIHSSQDQWIAMLPGDIS